MGTKVNDLSVFCKIRPDHNCQPVSVSSDTVKSRMDLRLTLLWKSKDLSSATWSKVLIVVFAWPNISRDACVKVRFVCEDV